MVVRSSPIKKLSSVTCRSGGGGVKAGTLGLVTPLAALDSNAGSRPTAARRFSSRTPVDETLRNRPPIISRSEFGYDISPSLQRDHQGGKDGHLHGGS